MSHFIPIINHANYLINENGEVYSLLKKRLLKIQYHKFGYPCTKLDKKGYLLHRLIAIHFIPNPENLPIVNYLDHNPRNFKKDNLEWCTQRHNLHHAIRFGRKFNVININRLDNEYSPTCKFLNKEIEAIRVLYDMGFYHSQISKMFPISVGYFNLIVKRNRRTLKA